MIWRSSVPALLLGLLSACSAEKSLPPVAPAGQWIEIFNGKNLDGWVPKISGHLAGENYANTFRVENGVLKVAYDQYGQFNDQFGGLYYKDKLSHFWIRTEYRFVGELASGAPKWATRDSGIMMLTQSPQSMRNDQRFPLSVELNLLGAHWWKRPTGDVCTNGGVHITVGGSVLAEQCTKTSQISIRGDQWVTAEAEVLAGQSIKQYINGHLVAEYQQPQLDDKDADAAKLLAEGATKEMTDGYLALQSNGHPIEFRKVEILPLDSPSTSAVSAQGAASVGTVVPGTP